MALQVRSDMELWDRPFQTMLIAVLGVNVLAHATVVPWWVLLASGIALAWKVGHLYFGWPLPRKRVLYSAGFLIGGWIVWENQTILGYEAATPFLVFLASLKLLETNRDRDAKFIIVTSYFLLMAHLLHSQSLGSTFFMAFDVAIITILMFQLHRVDRRLTGASLRPVVRLLMLTIPIWLCLFVVFPRFSVKLFRTKTETQSTGFSEGLDAGSVSSLAQSDEVAFRVKFKNGTSRNPELLYWRGATLYDGDGLKWQARPEPQLRKLSREVSTLSQTAKAEETTDYDVITENGHGLAIFTLPRLNSFRPGDGMEFLRSYVTSDNLVRLGTPKRDHIAYSAGSIRELSGEPETLPFALFRRTLVSVQNPSPQYQELVAELGENTRSPQQAMAKIDQWFADNDFRYTLSASQPKGSTIDDFLFNNRRGFCEHFAATSASLLRSLGFNARVVVGYQGGKWNSVSEALIVRSRDAHAWVEVWSPLTNKVGGRWMTYDPTASIAPLRIRMGGDFLDLPEEQQRQRDGVETERTLDHLSQNLMMKAIDRTVMLWDFAQMTWTQFLLGYDQSGQKSLMNQILNWLGLTSRPWIMLGLITAFFAITLRLLFLWHARTPREGVVQREWDHLAKELIRIGAIRAKSEGPLTILERVESPVIRDGIGAFIALQYGGAQIDRENLHTIRLARRAAKKISAQAFV